MMKKIEKIGHITEKERLKLQLSGFEFKSLPKPVRKIVSQQFLDDPFSQSLQPSDCLFIHIPKTAGTSMCQALNVKPMHIPLVRFKSFDESRFENSFKFAFVRHPFDRLYSAFNYLQGNIGVNRSQDIRWAEKYLSNIPDFEEFVKKLGEKKFRKDVKAYYHFRPQHHWIQIPGETKIGVDFCGRFETLKNCLLYTSPSPRDRG